MIQPSRVLALATLCAVLAWPAFGSTPSGHAAGPVCSDAPAEPSQCSDSDAFQVAQKEAVGESLPHTLDSGLHDGSPGGPTVAFSAVVEEPGRPWIRLHFEDVTLGAEDSIEVWSLGGDLIQTLHADDAPQGRAASVYWSDSGVEVSLVVGPSAQGAGFRVTSIEVGFVPDSDEKICGGADNRTLSSDPRVCLLSFQQTVCSNDVSILCSCPGGTCTAGSCVGGARAGLGCGDSFCPGGTCNVAPTTFTGTAFFIRGSTSNAKCMLTSGHNFYNSGENTGQTGNNSTTLHCRVYGCGTGNTCDVTCPGGVCTAGLCNGGTRDGLTCGSAGTCNAGPRNGAYCTPTAVAAPADQYGVTLVDGELQAGGTPHDWALMQVNHNPGFFGLNQATGSGTITVTGHGADSDTAANSKFQQTHSATGTRTGDVIEHFADTEGGNSGSPIIRDNKAWGIHNRGPGGACGGTDGNEGVWVGHTHGGAGRPLAPAITANCPGDFGDAPDPFMATAGEYPSLLANNGARHEDFTLEWLGANKDPDLNATLIDSDIHDDGVVFQGSVLAGTPLPVQVTVTVADKDFRDETGAFRYDDSMAAKRLYLNAWADWNGDGVWAAGEKVIGVGASAFAIDPRQDSEFTGNTGTYNFTLAPPLFGLAPTFYFRFRLDYGEDVGEVMKMDMSLAEDKGAAFTGEVEDYRVVSHDDPLAVRLTSFSGEASGGSVVLSWSTGSEINHLGFEVLRSAFPRGGFADVSGLILARGGPGRGAAYEFVDDSAEAGETYYYLLRDVDTSGANTLHGAGACAYDGDRGCLPVEVTTQALSAAEFCAAQSVGPTRGVGRRSAGGGCRSADWLGNEPGLRNPGDCRPRRGGRGWALACVAAPNAD